MKKVKLLLVSLLGFTLCIGQTVNNSSLITNTSALLDWSSNAFGSDVFIKNIGQYAEASELIGETVQYGIESGNGSAFITNNGIYFGYYVTDNEKLLSNPPVNPEKNYLRVPTKLFISGITFDNTQSSSILPSGANSQYYTYTKEGGDHFEHASTFDLLVINNLYDNIDLQLSFTHENGLNADFILKNGASSAIINAIPLNQQNVLNLPDGSIKFQHQEGAFQWYNPIQQGSTIAAAQNTNSNASQTIQTNFKDPQFATNNVAIDVEVDATGNIYIYGSDQNLKLRKYSPTGATIWTHVSPFQGSTRGWYGDLVVEPNGISYISSGNSLGESQKVSTAGTQLYYMNSGGGMELFNMEYNAGALDAAGIICSQPPGSSGIGFLNKQTGVITGITKVSTSVSEERGLYRSPNGTFFALSGANINIGGVGALEIASFDGTLVPNWTAPSGFTGNDFPYNGRPLRKHLSPDPFTSAMTPIPSTHHGIAASTCYVYVYNGVKLTQYNILNGATIKSVNIPGTTFGQNDGVQVDDCGGVYVGANGTVVKLNQELVIQNIVTVPNNVSDLTVSPNGDIIAAGDGFIGSISGLVPSNCDVVKFDVSIDSKDVTCAADDGEATALPFGGAAPYTYLWNTGAATKTITGLAPGKYWVDVSSAEPCVFTASDTIVLERSLDLSVSNDKDICELDSTSLSATSLGAITWSPSTGLSSANGANVKASPATTTMYYATATLGTCSAIDSILVEVTPLPVVDAGSTIIKCDFETKTINATGTLGATYSWSPSTGLSNASVLKPQTNIGTDIKYYLTISKDGCSSIDSMNVDILTPDAPENVISASSTSICEGEKVDFTTSYANLGASPSFQWKLNGKNITGATVDTFASIELKKGDSVTFVITSDANCSSGEVFVSNIIEIEVNPLADVFFSYSSGTYCSSDASTISPTSPATTGGTFSVVPVIGLSVNTTNGSFTPVTSTNGTYTVTYSIPGQCGNSYSVGVSVVNTADASFEYAKTTFCTSENNPLPNYIGTGTAGTFTSIESGIEFVNTSTGQIKLSTSTPPGTYQIVNTVNGGASCGIAKDTFEVTINAVPVSTFTGLQPKYCLGNGMVSTLIPNELGGTFSGSGIYNVNEFRPDSLIPASYTVNYQITKNGCSSSTNMATTLFSKPDPSFTGLDPEYCIDNGPVFLSATNSTGTYSGPGISETIFDPEVAGEGTHEIKYEVQNAAGCIDSFKVDVTVNPLPNADFALIDNEYCQYDGLITLVPNTSGGVFNGSGVSGSSLNLDLVTDTFVTITYEITDVNGCFSQTTQQTEVYPAPALEVDEDVSICDGWSVQLNAIGNGSFNWSPVTGLDNSTSSSPTVTPEESTTYTVTITDEHCFSSEDISVTVKPIPEVSAGTDFEKCQLDEVTFAANTNSSAGQVSWVPTVGLSDAEVVNPTCNIEQTTVYEVTVTENGCSASGQLTVTVNPLPIASFTYTRVAKDVNFKGPFSNGITGWEWDFGDRSAKQFTRQPTHKYAQEGLFIVTLIVSNDCGKDTVTFEMIVDDKTGSGGPNSVNENKNSSLNRLEVYPNPTTSNITIDLTENQTLIGQNASIALFSLTGRKVHYSSQTLTDKVLLNLDTIAKGSYLLTLKANSGESLHTIVVVN